MHRFKTSLNPVKSLGGDSAETSKLDSVDKYVTNEEKIAIVLQGESIVIDKASDTIDEIASPGAQTCVIVILNSSSGIAVAHIDTHIVAAKTLNQLIAELRELGATNIEAELIGGDFSILNQGSMLICHEIGQELKKLGIPTSHKYFTYQIPEFILPLCYLSVRLMNFLGPESYFYTLLCVAAATLSTSAINFFLEKSYDVVINVKSGLFKITLNDFNHSAKIMRKASPSQIGLLKYRATLDLKNPKNADQLAIIKINRS